MVSFNKMTLIGHLGRDPEMRYTPQGTAVTDFSVATSRRYTDSAGERREETNWFNVSAWNNLAELCNQYLQKGLAGLRRGPPQRPEVPAARRDRGDVQRHHRLRVPVPEPRRQPGAGPGRRPQRTRRPAVLARASSLTNEHEHTHTHAHQERQ